MPSASVIPAIPDNIEQINPVGPVLLDDERSVGSGLGGRSGLTTPNVLSPQSQDSRLTTPEQLHGTLPPPAGSSETSSTVRAGSDAGRNGPQWRLAPEVAYDTMRIRRRARFSQFSTLMYGPALSRLERRTGCENARSLANCVDMSIVGAWPGSA